MKIKGLKKAISEYTLYNKNPYSSERAELMFDTSDGELWTDYFVDENSWKVYHSDTIVNLGQLMRFNEIKVTAQNVKKFIVSNFPGFEN